MVFTSVLQFTFFFFLIVSCLLVSRSRHHVNSTRILTARVNRSGYFSNHVIFRLFKDRLVSFSLRINIRTSLSLSLSLSFSLSVWTFKFSFPLPSSLISIGQVRTRLDFEKPSRVDRIEVANTRFSISTGYDFPISIYLSIYLSNVYPTSQVGRNLGRDSIRGSSP